MFNTLECLSYNYVYFSSFPNHHLQDVDDNTPLMLAAYEGKDACVRSLLMKGMIVEIKHKAKFHT